MHMPTYMHAYTHYIYVHLASSAGLYPPPSSGTPKASPVSQEWGVRSSISSDSYLDQEIAKEGWVFWQTCRALQSEYSAHRCEPMPLRDNSVEALCTSTHWSQANRPWPAKDPAQAGDWTSPTARPYTGTKQARQREGLLAFTDRWLRLYVPLTWLVPLLSWPAMTRRQVFRLKSAEKLIFFEVSVHIELLTRLNILMRMYV
jgi:hypothetical protein